MRYGCDCDEKTNCRKLACALLMGRRGINADNYCEVEEIARLGSIVKAEGLGQAHELWLEQQFGQLVGVSRAKTDLRT